MEWEEREMNQKEIKHPFLPDNYGLGYPLLIFVLAHSFWKKVTIGKGHWYFKKLRQPLLDFCASDPVISFLFMQKKLALVFLLKWIIYFHKEKTYNECTVKTLLLSCTHSKDEESTSEESGKLLGDYPVWAQRWHWPWEPQLRDGEQVWKEQVHFCTCESASKPWTLNH